MTTDPIRSGLHPFSHLKAGPTTFSSKSTALPATSSTLSPSLSAHRPQLQKNITRDEQISATSEKATGALIRRVLCPQAGNYGGTTSPCPPEDLLPPLTSSNDVDRQLYALIAIIIKEFITSWYSKITSDQALVNEALQVIAHCTRALEERLRGADIAQLVLDELPALLETHIISYRLAKEQSNLSGFSPSSRDIYHALNPHPGLSPVPDPSDNGTVSQQEANEAIYRRLLVNGVLAVLLPTEDLENACLRSLVTDILADLVLGNEVSGKMCEGWFLWESITKLLDVLSRGKAEHGDNGSETTSSPSNRLQKFGLLSSKNNQSDYSTSTNQSQASSWIWRILQYIYLTYTALRFIATGLFRVASTPPVILTSGLTPSASLTDEIPTQVGSIGKRPVLDYRLSGMLSQLLDIPRRMPWLGGLLALFQYLILAGPGRLGDTDSVLDRFLHETIQDYVLTPTLLPNLLLASREALFPHNARPKLVAAMNRNEALTPTPTPHHALVQPSNTPGLNTTSTAVGSSASTTAPTVTVSPSLSAEEQQGQQEQRPSTPEIASVRRKCAASILSLIPRPIASRLLGISTSFTYSQEGLQGYGFGAKNQDPSAESDSESPRASPSRSSLDSSNNDNGATEESLLLAAIENVILDLFADEYCNKHLIYSMIETILAKILPELSDRRIVELMEDRGVFFATTGSD